MIPRLVHKIEGGYPERDIGAEEGQGWGDSRRLIGAVWHRRATHALLSQSVFLPWLDRELWQQFIINLNEIAAFNYDKEIDSDDFRPLDEFIIWRNVDRKFA